MLTPLQKKKLTHYFSVLDFDGNGLLEKQDFTSIGENLAILWGFRYGSEEYKKVLSQWESSWSDFREFMGRDEDSKATLEEWLHFADENIVNGSDELYEKHVNKVAREVIGYFDVNNDGNLSLDEYIDLFMAYRIEIRYSAKAFTKLDRNHDDYISGEELLTALRQFFRSNDENVPGNWLFGFWDGKSKS